MCNCSKKEIPSKEFTFRLEGKKVSAVGRVYSDAFYIITEGKYKGNLVHIFDVNK